MQDFWNERYSAVEAAYGKEPNAFLNEALQALADRLGGPGTLLLPCDGEGRNAVGAARAGWQVRSFDYSSAGVEKAQRWAAEAGVELTCTEADAWAFDPEAPADVVALIYAHMPAEKRADFHKRAASWLRPGGHLLLEGFHPDQIHNAHPSGGPRDLAMLFTPELLFRDFVDGARLEIVRLEHLETELAEGEFHRGPAAVTRLIARKPLDS